MAKGSYDPLAPRHWTAERWLGWEVLVYSADTDVLASFNVLLNLSTYARELQPQLIHQTSNG